MRILHVALCADWSADAAQAAILMAAELERGHHVTACVMEGSALHRHISALSDVMDIAAHPAADDPRGAWRLWRLLRRGQADVVHFHGNRGAMRLGLALRATRPAVPAVRFMQELPGGALLARRLRLFDHLVVPSRFMARRLERLSGGVPPITIVQPAVDTGRFRPQHWDNVPVRVGLFARLNAEKGHEDFLRACAKVSATRGLPPIQPVLGGRNIVSFPDRMFALIDRHHLPVQCDVVLRTGRVHAEIARLDVGVVASSHAEATSRAALEYMACGVPVVATAVGGLPELVGEDAGLLVPPGDPDAMARAIGMLLTDRRLRRRLGRQARLKVERRHDPARVARDLEHLDAALLGRDAPPRRARLRALR